jgi:hypothetical protein
MNAIQGESSISVLYLILFEKRCPKLKKTRLLKSLSTNPRERASNMYKKLDKTIPDLFSKGLFYEKDFSMKKTFL